jgi:two-component system, chemotaxis family, protein-glutamate methylesterase/glutaminase
VIASAPVRVVVVEDSVTQRRHLVHILEADGDISVVGEAVGATEAIDLVARVRPDVLTLDLEIPDGGGQHVIEQVMRDTPTPILVLSSIVESRRSAPSVDALMAGAVEALPKPSPWTTADESRVRRTVRALRGITVHPRTPRTTPRSTHTPGPQARGGAPAGPNGRRVVAIAASTGGPSALADVLSGLGELRAPVLLVQHLHAEFMDGFVEWMQRASPFEVQLARAGDRLEPRRVAIGPAGVHLRLGPDRRIALDPAPLTTHRPSADELFHSVAAHAGVDGIGVVLTGMGQDGAAGLLALRRAGGVTIAQDRATSAVFGMPGAAVRIEAVDEVVPLEQIAKVIVRAERGVRS